MKKKTNPRSVPAEPGELEREKEKAHDEALERSWAVFFSVLRDKEGFDGERLEKTWQGVMRVSEEINDGKRDQEDMARTLHKTAGIKLLGFGFVMLDADAVKTKGDVRREANKCRRVFGEGCWCIFLTALRDMEGYGPDALRRVWAAAKNLEDSIERGYVTVRDLSDELAGGANVELAKKDAGPGKDGETNAAV